MVALPVLVYHLQTYNLPLTNIQFTTYRHTVYHLRTYSLQLTDIQLATYGHTACHLRTYSLPLTDIQYTTYGHFFLRACVSIAVIPTAASVTIRVVVICHIHRGFMRRHKRRRRKQELVVSLVLVFMLLK